MHMQLAEVRHHSLSYLRSRSEDHLWFCQSENWQGWDLDSHEEGSETPLSGHSRYRKLGPRNQNSRKVRIIGSKQVQTKGCSLQTWKNIFAQELNFRCISIFTSTALNPSLDSNRWQKLSTPEKNCNTSLQTHVNGKWVGLLGCGSTRRHNGRKVLMASYLGHQDPSTSAYSFLGHSGEDKRQWVNLNDSGVGQDAETVSAPRRYRKIHSKPAHGPKKQWQPESQDPLSSDLLQTHQCLNRQLDTSWCLWECEWLK